jgi:hypothetical protein
MLTACCVIGCVGVAILGSLGFLAFVAVAVIGQLGQDAASHSDDGNEPGKSAAVRPGPRPGPITATKLTEDHVTLPLAGKVEAVGRGGNGRFLLLKVGGQIQVFDSNEGAFAPSFAFEPPDADFLFAASAAKLFVYRQGKLERYNLLDRAFEKSVPWLTRPVALVIGPRADGPLFVLNAARSETEVTGVDPEALTALGSSTVVRLARPDRPGPRVSADGRLIGLGLDPTQALGADPRGVLIHYPPGNPATVTPFGPPGGTGPYGHVAPAPDGRFVYTPKGVFDTNGSLLLSDSVTGYFYALPPAHGGDFFLSLEAPNPRSVPKKGVRAGRDIERGVRLHLAGVLTPLTSLPDLGPVGMTTFDTEQVPADLRVHFWPAAGLLAVLTTDSQLDLYRLDVPEILRNSGQSHLIFGSDPPTAATRRQVYTYTPEVWSNRTGPQPTLKVVFPPTMSVNAARQLVWPVPADAPAEVEVHLQVTDAGGRTADQKFRVVVTDP